MRVLTLIAIILIILGFVYGYITPQNISDVGLRVKDFFRSEEITPEKVLDKAGELYETAKGVGGSFIPSAPLILKASSTAMTLTAGVGNSTVLATSSVGDRGVERTYAAFINNCISKIFLSLDNDAPMPNTANTGIMLNPNGGSYEIISSENPYNGAVHASSSAACEILVTEGRR